MCGALIGRGFFGVVQTLFIVLAGIDAVGVGVFPETTGRLYLRCALVAFLFGALSAISAVSHEGVPLAYYSAALGIVSLAALMSLTRKHMHGLGFGGMERLVAFPSSCGRLASGVSCLVQASALDPVRLWLRRWPAALDHFHRSLRLG